MFQSRFQTWLQNDPYHTSIPSRLLANFALCIDLVERLLTMTTPVEASIDTTTPESTPGPHLFRRTSNAGTCAFQESLISRLDTLNASLPSLCSDYSKTFAASTKILPSSLHSAQLWFASSGALGAIPLSSLTYSFATSLCYFSTSTAPSESRKAESK